MHISCMDLVSLQNRFEFYAQKSKAIAHIPNDKVNRAFITFDMENMAIALATGLKFPCLFLEIPSTEKEGLNDNVFENIESTFMVLKRFKDGDALAKTTITQECKTICDKIYNRILADASDFYESQLTKTSEGIVTASATSGNLIGWMVAFGFTNAYNAEVNANDWEDLS